MYLTNTPTPIPVGEPTASTRQVLKRMVAPTKEQLYEVRKEVEVMVWTSLHVACITLELISRDAAETSEVEPSHRALYRGRRVRNSRLEQGVRDLHPDGVVLRCAPYCSWWWRTCR